ncbi:hypothetical protein C3747_226g43 [Trypanosoma cruzi]|uniref:Uncharacterized protein n=1 Tax=Trypanosoma cruzi TaxID=5693 RepID=A0A2V2VWX4_TRYCR|nr:hypothetical protein C3747_226g43 [Trypanosoma cruzi]RNC41050.1 hypothetical protein TcCL_NonESM09422 [Trypanosoma cruzi]
MAAPHPHPLESVVLRNYLGCVCAMPRLQGDPLVRHFVRVSRTTLPYAAAAARRSPLPPGDWEMDRPFTPCELGVAIRDSSPGSVPDPDSMLNELLHRLRSVARGTLRTMIHDSFANGSLPGSWEIGSIFLFPNPWEVPMPPKELQTYHATLCFTKVNRKDDSPPSVSVIAAPPTSIWICTFAFYFGRGGTCYW